MIKSIRIWLAKRRLRHSYQAYMSLLDNATCGRRLANTLPSVIRARERANYHLGQLRKLDPKAPLPSRLI